ncbi:hypothetical protein Tco_0227372 [Tanacetum coccineum]
MSSFMASQDARLSRHPQECRSPHKKVKTLRRLLYNRHGKRPCNPFTGRKRILSDRQCRDRLKSQIALGEGVTRSIFGVKEIDLGEEEVPYWTTLSKRESYKPRHSLDGIGAQPPYYVRKGFMDYHLPEEWEIARDAELNPFKDVIVFKRMVEFLGALPINLKGNIWESKYLIENPIN